MPTFVNFQYKHDDNDEGPVSINPKAVSSFSPCTIFDGCISLAMANGDYWNVEGDMGTVAAALERSS